MDGLKVKVEFKDIEDAYLKIRKSIRNKKKLYLFEKNYYSNCNILVDKINSGNYTYSNYHIFTITEKKRLIMSSTLEDKIVNHVICKKVLLPLDKYLIDVKREYLLEFNNKTKIYRSTEGFTFLGINYKVNNKIKRRIVRKTRRRLLEKNIKYYFKYEK